MNLEPPAVNKSTASASPRFRLGSVPVAMVIAAIALLFATWQWYDYRHRLKTIENSLAQRLADFDTRNKETRVLALQAHESMREATVKLTLLENKLAESQNQQVALEALYQELARSRDEWTLSEIEQILLIANQQLQLSGNVKSALIAMQTADNHLQRLNLPQLLPLRRAISKDIQRLQALPFVDIEGLSARLDTVIALTDELPLLIESSAGTDQAPPARARQVSGFWSRLGQDIWAEFKELVRIQNTERAQIPLLSPQQSYFLRENLKLRLLSARLSLLQHDDATFKRDIDAAYVWINKYFNAKARVTQDALNNLKQLSAAHLHIALPDINSSLETVRNFKLARESRS